MMSAKVGTGIVAELGAMRISEEMATAIVLVACYYGYNASGGPVGVGTATAKSMVLNLVLVTLIGMLGTQVFWGANPRAPIGG
jgi:phospholipid/cholesterol/gamma-HCH transport system permease protein